MLVKNKRSSQNALNEVGGFFLDKERADDIKRPMAYGLQLIAIFCVLFSFASIVEVKAQELRQGGATGIGEIKPLVVGQKVPEEFWTDSIAVYENGEIIRTTFGTYRGKPLLLDFWATWCSTCIAHMPELYNLDTYKNNELEIFPVTTEDGNKITAFVERVQRLNQLPFRTVVENNILPEYFKHYSVPFYVLLNADGMVQTMIGLKEMEESLISGLVENKHQIFESDLTKDFRNFPSLLASMYSEDPNYHYSFFYLGFNNVFGAGNRKRTFEGIPYSFTMLNVPVKGMLSALARARYQRDGIPFHHSFITYGKLLETEKIVLESKATFEIAVPKGSREDIIHCGLNELNKRLPFTVKFEDRNIGMYVLYKLSEPVGEIKVEDLSFSILATKLNTVYNEDSLFIDLRKEKTDFPVDEMRKDIVALKNELGDRGVGIRYERLNFPFLVIGE